MKRVAVYVRTSTADQNTALQKDELQTFCQARGWIIVEVFEDKMTGTHANRPEFQRLLRLARQRKIDVLACWKLDRAFRSLKDMVNVLQELTELGVEFISMKDQIDLTTTTGRLLAHLLGAFAEFEAALCRERVRAGLDAARRRGKKLGRPKTVDSTRIRELRRAGKTYQEISSLLDVSPGSIAGALSLES